MAVLAPFATASIDTSDGLLTALHTLARLGGFGVNLRWDPTLVAPDTAQLFREHDVPQFLTAIFEIGDFEVVLAIPDARIAEAEQAWPELRRVARATSSASQLVFQDRVIPLDLDAMVDLMARNRHSPHRAFDAVRGWASEWEISP
jgi:thiamine monophosphate kinase